MTEIELHEYHEHAFDAFCKRVIRNAAADAFREQRRRARLEGETDLSVIEYICATRNQDTYSDYCKSFIVLDHTITVKEQMIGESLQFIIPNNRNILLLSFFAGYSDSEISQMLNISKTTVARRKKAGLKRMKELLEARNNG